MLALTLFRFHLWMCFCECQHSHCVNAKKREMSTLRIRARWLTQWNWKKAESTISLCAFGRQHLRNIKNMLRQRHNETKAMKQHLDCETSGWCFIIQMLLPYPVSLLVSSRGADGEDMRNWWKQKRPKEQWARSRKSFLPIHQRKAHDIQFALPSLHQHCAKDVLDHSLQWIAIKRAVEIHHRGRWNSLNCWHRGKWYIQENKARIDSKT